MKKNKTFVLGVGAQKAGTSWLYWYIQKSSVSNMGPLKEYQYWNMYFKPKSKKADFLKKDPKFLNSSELLKYQMLTIDGFYENFFCSLINDGFTVTGDITPHYSKLYEEELQTIKSRLEKVDFNVKVIFLLRDPFERIWSNIRMEKKLDQTFSKNMTENDLIRTFHNDPRWRFDSLYHTQIFRIDSIFDQKDIYYGIYEEMFSKEKIRELSEFIGIDYNPTLRDRVVNKSTKTEEIDFSVKKEVCQTYQNTYRFCFERFPQTKYLWNFYR